MMIRGLVLGRKVMLKTIKRLVVEEQGGEIIEWALIAGLISVAAIAAVAAFGNRVLARWTSVNDSL
jgi:Flp pilus assembly pilin Flp